MPRVSVIVPVYNMQPYIHRCVDSILCQTERNIEIILVNDGSSDLSGIICDAYAKKDNRVRVIHKENGGLSSARNAGIDIARGDFIGFVDSDDYIDENMYECMLSASDRYQAPLVVAGRYDHSNDAVQTALTLQSEMEMTSRDAIERLLTWNGIDSSACDKVFSYDLFSSIRFPEGKYNEDIFVMTDIIMKAEKIVHIGEPKYHYVHREDSITTAAFTPEKMDLLDATEHVSGLVKNHYPELADKALYFHTKGLLYLYPLLIRTQDKNRYMKYEKCLRAELRSNLFKMLRNKMFSRKEKGIALALQMRIYTASRRVFRFLRNGLSL